MTDLIADIAVIGGGACGTYTIRSLTCKFSSENIRGKKILIFEKKPSIGTGYPYQQDFDCCLLNRKKTRISLNAIDDSEFSKYSELRGITADFVPRNVFGEYCRDVFHSTVFQAIGTGNEIELVFAHITRIDKADHYSLVDSKGNTYQAKIIILAIGGVQKNISINHTAFNKLINVPFPLKSQLSGIPETASVTIAGTRLTAVDCLLGLKASGHKGKVTMVSKSGCLPFPISQNMEKYELKYCTREHLRQLKRNNGFLSLNNVLRLVYKELLAAGNNKEKLKWLFRFKINSPEKLKEAIEVATHSISFGKYQSVFRALNASYVYLWDLLSEVEKRDYLERYDSTFRRIRVALPENSLKKVLGFLSEDYVSLKVLKVPEVQSDRMNTTEMSTDYWINATGIDPLKISDNLLLQDLCYKKIIRANDSGRIDISVENCSVINDRNESVRDFYVCGELTKDSFYFVSTLDIYINQIDSITTDICVQMKKNGTVDKNIKFLDTSYLNQILSLRENTLNPIKNTDLCLMEKDERKFILSNLFSHGFILGIKDQKDLIAVGILSFRSDDLVKIKEALLRHKKLFRKIALLNGTQVVKGYRGQNFQRDLIQMRLSMVEKMGYDMATAIASPNNSHSINNLQNEGFEKLCLITFYPGIERFVLYKSIKPQASRHKNLDKTYANIVYSTSPSGHVPYT